MSRLSMDVVCKCVIAVGLSAAVGAQDQRPQFRGIAEGVRVDVSVRTRNRPVTGLKPADFDLRDSGVSQEVVDLIYEEAPIDVTVGLDISRSVDGQLLEQLRRSVLDLFEDMRPRDRLKLASFNMRVLRQTSFITERRELTHVLATLSGSGTTSIHDMIAVSLIARPPEVVAPEAQVSHRRHLVMIFTDGTDTASITSSASLIEICRRSTAALGFVVGGKSLVKPAAPKVLERLADESGGRVLTTGLGADLSGAFRRLLEEFRTSYVLMFRPTGVEVSGFHPLEVLVKGSQPYEIRARKGYTK